MNLFTFKMVETTEFKIVNRSEDGNLVVDLEHYNLSLAELGSVFRSLCEVGDEGKPVYVIMNDPSDPANGVVEAPEFFFDDDPDSWDNDVFKVTYGPIEWEVVKVTTRAQ